MHKELRSYRAISKSVNRSIGANRTFLMAYNAGENRKASKRNSKISPRQTRTLIRTACTGLFDANDLNSKLDLNIGIRHIHQILARSKKVRRWPRNQCLLTSIKKQDVVGPVDLSWKKTHTATISYDRDEYDDWVRRVLRSQLNIALTHAYIKCVFGLWEAFYRY